MITTTEERDLIAKQIFEAAVLVEYANSGKKVAFPSPEMYEKCAVELANIAVAIKGIRAKGFGADIIPNQFTH